MLLEEFPFEPGFRLIDGDQLNKVAAEPAYSVDNTVTATGTSQNTAYNIRATVTVVTAGGDNAGIRLPQPKVGRMIFVLNYTATGKRIYPYDTELINGANSADLPFDMGMVLICTSFGSWAASQVETNTTGDIVLVASDADTATGDGHLVNISGGQGGTTSGDGGDVTIEGGDAANGKGGDIVIDAGTGTTPGTVTITPAVSVGVSPHNVLTITPGVTEAAQVTITSSSKTAGINFDSAGLSAKSISLIEQLIVGIPLATTSLIVSPGVTGTDPVTIAAIGTAGMLFQSKSTFSVSLAVGAGTNNILTVTPGAGAANVVTMAESGTGGIMIAATKTGFNSAAPIAKPTITGSRGGNAALLSLLTALVNYGLVTDTTTA